MNQTSLNPGQPQSTENTAMREESSRDITDYIKGIAILGVLLTHFAISYDNTIYQEWLNNYGNAFIAVFFLLAGYGAYYSFDRRIALDQKKLHLVLKYIWDRAVRIYPLYWAGVFLSFYFEPEYFSVEKIGMLKTVGVLMAFPLSTSPLWFIVAIMQCYLLAPLLFFIYRRLGLEKYLVLTLLSIGAVLLISEVYFQILGKVQGHFSLTLPDPYELLFRGVFLGNVLLFAAGLMLPPLIEKYGYKFRIRKAMIFSVIALIVASVILRYDIVRFHIAMIPVELTYYLYIFNFCLFLLVVRPRLFFKKNLTLLGRHSLALYMFHGPYYDLLIRYGLFREDSLMSIIFVLLLFFPGLLGFCCAADRGLAILYHKIGAYWNSRKVAPVPEGGQSAF